jgi:hypothetical protein
VLKDEAPAQIGETKADGVAVDVGNQNARGLRSEPHQTRRAPAYGAPDTTFVDKAEGSKRREPVGDHGAAEPGLSFEVEARAGFIGSQNVEKRNETLALGFEGFYAVRRRRRDYLSGSICIRNRGASQASGSHSRLLLRRPTWTSAFRRRNA